MGGEGKKTRNRVMKKEQEMRYFNLGIGKQKQRDLAQHGNQLGEDYER